MTDNRAPFRLDDAELMGAFEPFITRQYAAGDADWTTIEENLRTAQRRAKRRRQWIGWIRRFRRTQRGIKLAYSMQWTDLPLEKQLTGQNRAPFVFRDYTFEARTQGEKRVHHRILLRAVEQLRPTRVLEVGAGNGVNLLALAARFPDLALHGLELTSGGVAAAARIRACEKLPQEIIDFAVDPPRDPSAHRRIRLVQGNGGQLPFRDGAFDLVYTVLALEQMEEIRHAALAEVRRVSRAHVLMIEPFRDWNGSEIQRNYIKANDYFAAAVADLPGYGLQPVYADQVPSKLFRGAGAVLAAVR